LKILFFGSSDLSVPFMQEIFKSGHPVVLAVTKPDSRKSRGRKTMPNPVKAEAVKLGIPYYELKTFREDFYKYITGTGFELTVVVSFGKIFPSKFIDIAGENSVNMHPSILPQYRGPSPIITALLNGDKMTGISLVKIAKSFDTGNIYRIRKIPILIEDNRETLEKKIISLGKKMLVDFIEDYGKKPLHSYPQPTEGISYTKIFTKEDTILNWKESSEKIFNKIRAFGFSPGCITTINGRIVKILKAKYAKQEVPSYKENANPGEVVRADKEGLVIKCGNTGTYPEEKRASFLSIEILKPQNKNAMSCLDFLNGYKIKAGDYFK